MNLNPIRKALGVTQKPTFFEPEMKGPPDNPEYFILMHRPGQWPKYEMDNQLVVRNLEEEKRLFDLRRSHHALLFPDKKPKLDYGFRYQNSKLCADHLPKFQILKKRVKLSEHMFVGMSAGSGEKNSYDSESFVLVRPALEEALESLAPDFCQFFPFEYRLKTGEVVEKFLISHFPKIDNVSVVVEKSGYTKRPTHQWDFHSQPPVKVFYDSWDLDFDNEDYIRNGQIIIRRPSAPTQPLYFFGSGSGMKWLFSKALADRMRPHIPKIDDFYPVHVEERH